MLLSKIFVTTFSTIYGRSASMVSSYWTETTGVPSQWQPTSTYSPFVRSGASPTIQHPPYTRTETPMLTTRVMTIVETVPTGPTALSTTAAKISDTESSSGSETYYTTTVAYGTYGAVTVSGTPVHPNTFKPTLYLTYNPAAAVTADPNPPASTSHNVLADLDPDRPTKALVFAIQRYADANCEQPVGPRFAYDGSQDDSCFFKKGSCRGSCGYLGTDNGASYEWKHKRGTMPKNLLEQYDFGSWDYKLVTFDDVWNDKNKWQKAPGHIKHKHKNYQFPEANFEGTAVCDATFWQRRDCQENSQLPESGHVMKWQPKNLRVDEGRCMNEFKNGRGVPAMAQSFRIKCYI